MHNPKEVPFKELLNIIFIFSSSTERKLREKAESQIKSLEKDMASIKSGSLLASGADGEAEMLKLRSEVERLEVSTQETLLAQQAKHNLEISGLKEQLEEADRRMRTSDLDMASLREKLDQARLDSLQVSFALWAILN